MKVRFMVVLAMHGHGTWEASRDFDISFTPSMEMEFEVPGMGSPLKPTNISFDTDSGTLSVFLGIVHFSSNVDRADAVDSLQPHGWTITGCAP